MALYDGFAKLNFPMTIRKRWEGWGRRENSFGNVILEGPEAHLEGV
ncbi:MAG: hypothetical protein ACI8T1_003188 [Verrucomicrobiales bacterium]|jgi:hypothetical protein